MSEKSDERNTRKVTEGNMQLGSEGGTGCEPREDGLSTLKKKYKISIWSPPKQGNTTLTSKTSMRYLGVIMDSNLTWRSNVEERVRHGAYLPNSHPGSTQQL